MRAENELDNVNVELRAQRARERVGTNGRLQGINHQAPILQPTWFQRLFPREHLIVGGREVKGFVLPHWAAGVLLAAILSSMGVMYARVDSQRDMLIEMKTELRMDRQYSLEERARMQSDIKLQKAYIDNMTNNFNTIKGLLTPQQLRYLEEHTKKTEN